MEAALLLLLVFLVYSVLLGVCIARLRGVLSELATLKMLVRKVADVQRDIDGFSDVVPGSADDE